MYECILSWPEFLAACLTQQATMYYCASCPSLLQNVSTSSSSAGSRKAWGTYPCMGLSIISLIIIPHPWKLAQIFVCALLTCNLRSSFYGLLCGGSRGLATKRQCTCQQWHLRESSPKSMVTTHQCVFVSAQKECDDPLRASTQDSTESIHSTALLSWPGLTRASQRASWCLRVEKFHMRPLLLTSSWSLFLRFWPHTQHLQIDASLRLHPLTSVTVTKSTFHC